MITYVKKEETTIKRIVVNEESRLVIVEFKDGKVIYYNLISHGWNITPTDDEKIYIAHYLGIDDFEDFVNSIILYCLKSDFYKTLRRYKQSSEQLSDLEEPQFYHERLKILITKISNFGRYIKLEKELEYAEKYVEQNILSQEIMTVIDEMAKSTNDEERTRLREKCNNYIDKLKELGCTYVDSYICLIEEI